MKNVVLSATVAIMLSLGVYSFACLSGASEAMATLFAVLTIACVSLVPVATALDGFVGATFAVAITLAVVGIAVPLPAPPEIPLASSSAPMRKRRFHATPYNNVIRISGSQHRSPRRM